MSLPSLSSVPRPPHSPEVVAPAGNREKLETAVTFGADAVYLGAQAFNLRSKSGNFHWEELGDALTYCHDRGVRAYFLLNAFLPESRLPEAREAIGRIRDLPWDGIIFSDLGMLGLLREAGVSAPLHVSTQANTLNHAALAIWQQLGAKRVVLAREVTLDEIVEIRRHTDLELEVFAHGALCMAYSGRCLMSRYYTDRDANQGACAHPCRWEYNLVERQRPSETITLEDHPEGTAIMASRDLCLLRLLPAYAAAGVRAFKLEGRMKTAYYAALVTRVYAHAVSLVGTPEFDSWLPRWEQELDQIQHRPYTDSPFRDGPTPAIGRDSTGPNGYRGQVRSTANDGAQVVWVTNSFRLGDSLEALSPRLAAGDRRVTVESIATAKGVPLPQSRPGEEARVRFSEPLPEHTLLRAPVEVTPPLSP